jgi:hypothetical protein
VSAGLERLERDTYRSFFTDGLVDIAIGAFVLAIGVASATDIDTLPGVVGALAAPAWILSRRWLVAPRVGTARLRARRIVTLRKRLLTLTGGLLVMMLLGAGALAVGGGDVTAIPAGRVVLPVSLGVFLATAGALMDFPRAVGYAVALPVARFLGDAAGLPDGWALSVLGATIVTIGLLLLARFLRRHPRPRPEVGHAR